MSSRTDVEAGDRTVSISSPDKELVRGVTKLAFAEHWVRVGDMKFPEYFLVVQDFVNWAKDQGIRVGPGRGSAAGSNTASACSSGPAGSPIDASRVSRT